MNGGAFHPAFELNIHIGCITLRFCFRRRLEASAPSRGAAESDEREEPPVKRKAIGDEQRVKALQRRRHLAKSCRIVSIMPMVWPSVKAAHVSRRFLNIPDRTAKVALEIIYSFLELVVRHWAFRTSSGRSETSQQWRRRSCFGSGRSRMFRARTSGERDLLLFLAAVVVVIITATNDAPDLVRPRRPRIVIIDERAFSCKGALA